MFAVSRSGAQAVGWVSAPQGGTDGRLYVAVGRGAPTEIRDSLGPVEAHGESPPKISYGPDGGLYAVYTVGKVVPGQRFPLAALRLVQSRDNGRTWSAPVTVTDDGIFGAHNFEALHVAGDGTIYVSWLGMPGPGNASAVRHPVGVVPPVTATTHDMSNMASIHGSSGRGSHEVSASWITHSTDGGRTWSPRVRVDLGEACPCCRTALATGTDGTLYMAWRHVFPGSIRDIVVAHSADHGATWSAPVRAHADNWVFDACPHAGPALDVDSAGALHVVWWTGKEGTAGVYTARSANGAMTFEPPVALGVAQYSRPSHVQLALASGNRVVVAWDDGTKQVPQVVLRVSEDGGRHFAPVAPVSTAGVAATFPVLGISGDSVAVAWSEQSAQAAQAEARAMPNMKDPKVSMGLQPVGDMQVLVRRGSLK